MFQCISSFSYEGTVVLKCHPCLLLLYIYVVRFYVLFFVFDLVILFSYYATWIPIITGKLKYGMHFFFSFL